MRPALLAPLLGGVSVPADWYNASWSHRKPYVINSGQVAADVLAFPVMITALNDADMQSTAQRDGRDIVFADTAKNKLPHELIDYFSGIEHEAGWVWFVRPQAVRYVGTQDRTYATWQKNSGAITIGQFDHGTKAWSTPFDLHAAGDTTNLYPNEDHGPASILVRASDKRLLTFNAGHAGPDIFMRVSTNPEDATAWQSEVNLDSQLGMQGYSYPCPFQFADGTLWLIFRARNSPTTTPTRWYYSQSTDGGATWATAVEIVTTNAYGYLQVAQQGDTLYFSFTPDHPRFNTTLSLYCFKYIKGIGFRTLGNSALTAPMNEAALAAYPVSARVYDGSGPNGRSWTWDIMVGTDGHPRILYTRCGDTEHHLIHFARWTGSAWVDALVVDSLSHIGSYNPNDSNYQDPWYAGGACFDFDDQTSIYVARQINGAHEIWNYTTADNGATWAGTAVTSDSKRKNFRPVVPRGSSPELKVLWRYGVQPDYTRHLTGITSHPLRPRVNLLAARVKVDVSAASPKTIYAYWGNPAAAAQEDRANVWAAADKIVWHGRDGYNSATASVSDSTSNGNNGTKIERNAPYEVAGKAFRGQHFDGSDYVNFGAINMAGLTGLTCLAGVKYAGTPTLDEHTVLNNWSNTEAGIICRIDPTTTPAHKLEVFVLAASDTQIGGTSSLVITPNTWTMTGLRYSSATGLDAIRNGTIESVAAASGALDATASGQLFAGRYGTLQPTTEFFTGDMEAVLVSSEKKSDAYVSAWYQTWNSPQTFAAPGAVQSI